MSSMPLRSVFWALWSNRVSSPWTLPRCVWWWNGPLLLDVSRFSASWALPIFTDVLYVTTARWQLPSPTSPPLSSPSSGPRGRRRPFSRLWAHGYPHIVDRFSNFAHFVPLPSLPPAAEMGTHVLHVFWLHSLLSDIVSDRGPQFTSWVWRSFCSTLGVAVSLSSGYHPQFNGQTERVNQTLEGSCDVWRLGILASGALAMGGISHQLPGVCGLWYVSLPGLAWLSAPLFEFQEDVVAVPPVRTNLQRCWVYPTFHIFRENLCRSRLLFSPTQGEATEVQHSQCDASWMPGAVAIVSNTWSLWLFPSFQDSPLPSFWILSNLLG